MATKFQWMVSTLAGLALVIFVFAVIYVTAIQPKQESELGCTKESFRTELRTPAIVFSDQRIWSRMNGPRLDLGELRAGYPVCATSFDEENPHYARIVFMNPVRFWEHTWGWVSLGTLPEAVRDAQLPYADPSPWEPGYPP